MEQLYKEMQERLRYLEAQEQTEEIKWRIAEMTLSLVRVQQLLLANVSRRSELLLEEQSNWLMANTSLGVEKIVNFKEHFK